MHFGRPKKRWPCIYSHGQSASCISSQPAVLTTQDDGCAECQCHRAHLSDEGGWDEHLPSEQVDPPFSSSGSKVGGCFRSTSRLRVLRHVGEKTVDSSLF